MKLIILNLFYYLLCVQAAYAQTPTNGLAAYWSFDEGTGTTAQDSTGHNNTGTLFNGPSWVSGRSGNALSFDGINDYVEINDNNPLDLTGGEFTLSAWIYPESYGENLNGRIIDHGGGSAGEGGWSLLVNNYQNDQNLRQSIRAGNDGNSIYSNIGSISLNNWQHVVVTLEFGTITFYVNGQIEGQTEGVPSPTDRNAPVRIGMRDTDFFRAFTGVIDEVQIYNRALSPQDIMDLYNQAPPLSDMNPPVISDGQPSGILPLNMSTATLSVTTDEASTCKYTIFPDIPYSQMQDTFSNTGGTIHTDLISGLEYIQSRTYYVKCRDLSGNSNPDNYTVSFSFNRTVYSISPLGSDENPGTDVLPMKTIQHALDSYSENNSDETIIKVAQGTYYENISIVCCSLLTNLQILGGWSSNFSVREDGPGKTVIDGGGQYGVIYINVPTLDLTIENVTIMNGFSSSNGGGIALYPFNHGNVTLHLVNNIIAHNKSGSAGGGIYVFSKESSTTVLTLSSNVILNNSADNYCGGVCVLAEDISDTTFTLTGNTIANNRAGHEGGGIYVRSYNGAEITSTFTDNFIIQNSAAFFGAGMYAYAESGATLSADFTNNRISGNTHPYFGGGIYLHSASDATLTLLNFTKNTIIGNTASIHGGGIYQISSFGATITSSVANTNNNIADNIAEYDGGGFFSWGTTASTFTNSMITDNTAYRGGGIFAAEGTTLTLTNSTITGNDADYLGGGIYALYCSSSDFCCIPDNTPECSNGTHAPSSGTSVNIINTIVYGNTAAEDGNDIYIESVYAQAPYYTEVNTSYSNINNHVLDTIFPGTYNDLGNNIPSPPLLKNPADRDYHLSALSPLIDKGNDSAIAGIGTDFDEDPRITYNTVDIGADEQVFRFVRTGSLQLTNGDLSEYAGADGIPVSLLYGGTTGPAGAVWGAFDDNALYLAYSVSDTLLNASVTARDGAVMNDDSVGWSVDTSNDDGGSADPYSPFMLPDDYLGLASISNIQYDAQGTPSGAPAISWNGSWGSAVMMNGSPNSNTDTDTGYTVEIMIPWTTLGYSPSVAQTPFRMGFIINDRDDSACAVEPEGTYVDAEYFTETENEQSDFSEETAQAGYLNSGYLNTLLPESRNLFTYQVPPTAYLPSTPFEIGVKWTSDTVGYVTGVRFYKHGSNTNTHKGRLWQGQTLLANKTFVLENPAASGWQTVYFDNPVPVSAGVTYTATINRVNGYYYQNNNYFGAVDNAPLHIAAGQSGIYQYGPSSNFECSPPCIPANYPSTPINANYWVDVEFVQSLPSCSDISGREYKKYELEFPAGEYMVWLRGYAKSGADTVLVGVDGSCIGTYQFTAKNQWSWSNTAIAGANSTGALPAGTHHIDIWARQADVLIDGLYLTTGAETPSDSSHGTDVDPAHCSTATHTIWPENPGAAFENASNWQEIIFTVPVPYYCDYDRDGYADTASHGICTGEGCAPSGCQTDPGDDCDDNNYYAHPDQIWYKDADNDDYSEGSTDTTSCTRPEGYKSIWELTVLLGDCNDTDASLNPGVNEIWYDGVDQNCDGLNDYDQDRDSFVLADDCDDTHHSLNPNTLWYQDYDGDSYGNPLLSLRQCTQPSGYVLNNTDCDDTHHNHNPNTLWYQDYDGDGYGNPLLSLQQCTQPSGYVLNNTDCDDTNAGIVPAAYYTDFDGDGHGNPAIFIIGCTRPEGYVQDNTDCDDNDMDIYQSGPIVRRTGGTPSYYSLLQDAYNGAFDGETIQCKESIHTEDLYFNQDKTVYVKGGYDCSFSFVQGITTLNGSTSITGGTVIIEDFQMVRPEGD